MRTSKDCEQLVCLEIDNSRQASISKQV